MTMDGSILRQNRKENNIVEKRSSCLLSGQQEVRQSGRETERDREIRGWGE